MAMLVLHRRFESLLFGGFDTRCDHVAVGRIDFDLTQIRRGRRLDIDRPSEAVVTHTQLD